MNKVIQLFKVFFRSGNSLTLGTKKKTNYWLIPLLILSFLPICIQMGVSAYALTAQLQLIGSHGLVLYSGLIAGTFMIFFFGLFYVLGVFYFSKDIEFILTLPLQAWQILTAKFATVVVYEYLVMLVILAPFFVGYGLASKGGVLFILYALIIFLGIPVIPLSIASIPILIMMRFTGFAKNRDNFKYFTGVLALVLAVGVSVFMQKYAVNLADASALLGLIESSRQTVTGIGNIIPGVSFAVNALTNYQSAPGILNLFLFLICVSLLYFVFVLFGKAFYFNGVIGINESSAKREKMNVETMDKKLGKEAFFHSYVLKEIRLLFRTPIYFINCILSNFLIPVFLVIPFLVQEEAMSVVSDFGDMAKENGGIAVAAIFAFSLFVASTNAVTSTSISREGSNLFIMKYLPMPIEKQIWHKVMSGVWISGIAVILIFAMLVFVKLPAIIILCALLVSVNGVLFSSMSGIIADLFNPKLVWDNEQAAVKQNMNALINLLVAMIAGAIAVIPTLAFGFNLVVTTLYLIIVFSVINYLLYGFISKKSAKLIMSME